MVQLQSIFCMLGFRGEAARVSMVKQHAIGEVDVPMLYAGCCQDFSFIVPALRVNSCIVLWTTAERLHI